MYTKIIAIIDSYLERNFPRLHRRFHRHQTGLRYLLAGSMAALVDLALLYIFTDWFGVWYLASATIAFLGSFLTSFVLQKFWTFRDHNLGRIPKQLTIYLIAGVASLFLNSTLMYFWVDILRIWYMSAQMITAGILAIGSFLLNHKVTFKKHVEI